VDLDITKDDALLQGLILAVTDLGQKYTNRIFVETAFQGSFDCLQMTKYENSPFLDIKRAPLGTITAFEIYTNGNWTAFTDYLVKPTNSFSRILFPNGVIVSDYTVPYIIRISFPAGYGALAVVPEGIKTALKQHVAFFYENRGDTAPDGGKGIPAEVKALYSKYRILATY
jgi:uncharacterized phiE125 gp8 family phage protein